MDRRQITIITVAVIVVIIIVAAIFGYIKWSNLNNLKNSLRNLGGDNIDATQGVLPSLQTNPLENKPDLNPATTANPIKDIKTNPFE